MDLVFIDIETTHLDPIQGEIIEFAVCRITKHCREIDTFKIKPKHLHTADPVALEINGYNAADWRMARELDTAVDIMYNYLQGNCIVIGHNVEFDLRFINTVLQSRAYKSVGRKKICTRALALEHLPYMKSHSLQALRKFFNISTDGAHRAYKDMEDMKLIYYKLIRASAFSRLLWWIKWKIQVSLSG